MFPEEEPLKLDAVLVGVFTCQTRLKKIWSFEKKSVLQVNKTYLSTKETIWYVLPIPLENIFTF